MSLPLNGTNKGGFILDNVKLGTLQVDKIYVGDTLNWQYEAPDTQAPVTEVYPNPEDAALTHYAGTKVWFEVNEAADTYYTLDGTTPTEASTLFVEPFVLNETTTLKYFSVDTSGNKEAVKTTVFDITGTSGYRYVRVQGYGDQTGIVTRIIELEALEAATGTNLLAGLLPISGEAANSPNTVAHCTNGIKEQSTANQVYWWIAEGIPNLIYDLGSSKNIEQINYIGYSPSTDGRTTQFIIYVSNDNTNWTTVTDYSGNTTVQPPEGFGFIV
jgi:hypothetical protein